MIDLINNQPIHGPAAFRARYKLIESVGNEAERSKLIDVAYDAIWAIGAAEMHLHLARVHELTSKVKAGPNGPRIFYDVISKTTRSWHDLLLAHTSSIEAAQSIITWERAISFGSQQEVLKLRLGRQEWRRKAVRAMRDCRGKLRYKSWNPWCPADAADAAERESLKISGAINYLKGTPASSSPALRV